MEPNFGRNTSRRASRKGQVNGQASNDEAQHMHHEFYINKVIRHKFVVAKLKCLLLAKFKCPLFHTLTIPTLAYGGWDESDWDCDHEHAGARPD